MRLTVKNLDPNVHIVAVEKAGVTVRNELYSCGVQCRLAANEYSVITRDA